MKKIEEHRNDLLKQINEKQFEKIKERKKTFEEGIKLKEEELNRQKTLRETMKNKIDDLK